MKKFIVFCFYEDVEFFIILGGQNIYTALDDDFQLLIMQALMMSTATIAI